MASIRLMRRAEINLEAAVLWYETVRGEAQARQFEANLDDTLERLASIGEECRREMHRRIAEYKAGLLGSISLEEFEVRGSRKP